MAHKKTDKKITNEKPISFDNLNFRQVLSALLKIRPAPKEKKNTLKNKSGK